MGPFHIYEKDDGSFDIEDRNSTWNKEYGMIFIDNPVGAGYSFTDDGGYCHNEYEVSDDLYNGLI